MNETRKAAIKIFVLLVCMMILVAIATEAAAWKGSNYDEQDTVGCMCVSGGLSDSDLSKGLSLAMANGAHELDFSTQMWQFSAVYALQVNEEEEGAASFKLGKRWDKFAEIMMHVTYTPEQGQNYGDWVTVGGTWRF